MSAEILQEYLVKLGYATDSISFKKMDSHLSATTKKILGAGSAITGIAAATATATAAFAYNMRKMYFASELSNSSVKNLRAMEYAGKQIGVGGDSMESSIHGMAQALRLEPGLQAFLQNIGVPVAGRDSSDVMIDLVTALKQMPEFQATQIAGMFGISPDDYHQMATHLDELKAKKMEHVALGKQMGVDLDTQKEAVRQYTAGLDKLGETFGFLEDKVMIKFLPLFNKATAAINENLKGQAAGIDSLWSDLKTVAKTDFDVAFDAVSAAFGLPNNLLKSIAKRESAMNPNAKSKAGALGLMQFMPDTAKQYGIDPMNPIQSITAAGAMVAHLLSKYKGNLSNTVGAYNWGEGNMDSWLKTGKGLKDANGQPRSMPTETQNYMRALGSDGVGSGNVVLNQQVHQHITGNNSGDIAAKVATKQDRINANTARYFKQGAQ